MQEWIDFYRPHFPRVEAATEFVAACERQRPPDNVAKILMHQAQRLISLADDLPEIRPHQEALQLLFLIMCAENIAKLYDGFHGEGQSRQYVRRFFERFFSGADQGTLGRGFIDNNDRFLQPIGFDRAVDVLYNVRCDVVHEGNYTDFSFHDSKTPILNTDPDVTVHITLRELRDMIVRGCINAVRGRL